MSKFISGITGTFAAIALVLGFGFAAQAASQVDENILPYGQVNENVLPYAGEVDENILPYGQVNENVLPFSDDGANVDTLP